MLVLGTLTLDPDPYVGISYEYSQSTNGTVVGGTKKITLSNTLVLDSTSALLEFSNEVKDWFAEIPDRYLNGVTIDGQTYDFLYIDNVSVDSEDWVNTLSYTITLVAKIEASAVLPTNILGISYEDYITSLDISESLSISPDKSNNFFDTGDTLSLNTIQDSVSWEIKISVSCLRTDTLSAIQNAHNTLTKILITTPDRKEFDNYKSWTMYLHNRTLESNPTNGSVNFTCKALLVPPDINVNSLVNIQTSKNHNYISNSHSASVNLKVTGLVGVTWSSIIDLPIYYITNKITNAKTTLDSLINYYNKLENFPSNNDLIPLNQECPVDCNIYSNDICYVAKNISIEKNLTEGVMSATIEWSADNNYCNNGLSIEIEKTTNDTDNTILEQSTMWIQEPIITNMGCRKTYTESYNINISSKYNCIDNSLRNIALEQFDNIVQSYDSTFVLVKKTLQQNNNSCSLSCEFIQQCPLPTT